MTIFVQLVYVYFTRVLMKFHYLISLSTITKIFSVKFIFSRISHNQYNMKLNVRTRCYSIQAGFSKMDLENDFLE